jgi:hypothetical protein
MGIAMNRRDDTHDQVDFWDLTIRTVGTFAGMDEAIKRLSADLYAHDKDLSKQLPTQWSNIHAQMFGIKHEQVEINCDSLDVALKRMICLRVEAVGNLRRSLARADQLLGRAKYMGALVGRAPTP